MTARLIITSLLLLQPARLMASYFENNYLLGASIIRQYADISSTSGGQISDTGSGFGLYLERYLRQHYRLNGTLSYAGFTEFDILQLTASADYLFPITTQFSFFTGITIGAAVQKYSTDGFSNSAGGAIYGIQFGGIKYLSDSYLLEFGTRLRATDLTVDDDFNNSSSTVKNINEFYFSLLFMF